MPIFIKGFNKDVNAMTHVGKRFSVCILFLCYTQGPSQVEWGNPTLRNRKKCCRKMVLFPKALFLVTFSKK